jgi:GWxTD domain-containing protein
MRFRSDQTMKTIPMCAILAILVSMSAVADVSPKLADWAEGPVRHLMTKEEVKKWKTLRSDDEAQAFIDLFWARRDPTPNTPRNEFREDFEARVDFADRNFGTGNVRGALSDQGKVFILFGPPYRVSGKAGANAASASIFGGATPGSAPVDSQGHLLLGHPTAEPNQQFWMYAHEKKPAFVSQADFTIVFADEGHGDWRLGTTERVNPELLFMQAVNAFIVSPKMTKAPVYEKPAPVHRTSFTNPDLKAAWEQFRSGDKQTIGNANLTWGEFVTSEGEQFVSAQVYVPAGGDIPTGQRITSFAVVENKSGEIVDVKEDEATMMALGNDAYTDRSLDISPGTYTATFGVASGGRILAASRTPMTIEGLDPAATGVSPLLLASTVYALKTEWRPTDPFTFGGIKVVPKGDASFAPSGDLWYFVELRNPGVTDQGVPNVRVRIDIQGKTAKGPVEMKIPMKDTTPAKLSGEKGRYGLGLAIPLEGFVPGDYTMKVRVVDGVLGKNYDLDKQFRVH